MLFIPKCVWGEINSYNVVPYLKGKKEVMDELLTYDFDYKAVFYCSCCGDYNFYTFIRCIDVLAKGAEILTGYNMLKITTMMRNDFKCKNCNDDDDDFLARFVAINTYQYRNLLKVRKKVAECAESPDVLLIRNGLDTLIRLCKNKFIPNGSIVC